MSVSFTDGGGGDSISKHDEEENKWWNIIFSFVQKLQKNSSEIKSTQSGFIFVVWFRFNAGDRILSRVAYPRA